MSDRITVTEAARLNGDADSSYRVAITQYMPKMGVRRGKDRFVSFWETVALRTLTELNSAKLNLEQAAQRVRALFKHIERTAEGMLGGGKQYVFAVEAWGRVEGRTKRAGYIVEGTERLAECIAALAKGGWPNVRVISLTAIVAETVLGWDIATSGRKIAEARYRGEQAGKTPEEQAIALRLFNEMADEMEGRLGKSGARRPEPPDLRATDWQPWTPETVAA